MKMKIALFPILGMVLCFFGGNVSSVEMEARRPKNCKKPNAKHDTVLSVAKGCIKQTCSNGFWKSSMNDDVCCFKQEAYQPGTVIDNILAEDGCTEMTVHCSQVGGAATVVFKNKNSCPKPATEAQLENQTQVLGNKMYMLEGRFEEEIEYLEVHMVEHIDMSIYILEEKMNKLEGLIGNLTQSLEKCMAKQEAYGAVLRLPTQDGAWTVKKGDVDAIDFVSTSTMQIRGIRMFGSISGSANHSGLIQLIETLSQTVITSETFQYTSKEEQLYYDKLFASQYVAEMGVKYTITIEYYNTDAEEIWRGTGGQAITSTLCNGNTITFQFSESADSTNGSNEGYGQIPWILFSC